MTTTDQIQELAMRMSETSRCSYHDIKAYLNEAVTVYNIELPDPDTLDYTVKDALQKLIRWVEQQKRDQICSPSPYIPDDSHIYELTRFHRVPVPVIVRNTTPKEYGQMLQSKRRGKYRNR